MLRSSAFAACRMPILSKFSANVLPRRLAMCGVIRNYICSADNGICRIKFHRELDGPRDSLGTCPKFMFGC